MLKSSLHPIAHVVARLVDEHLGEQVMRTLTCERPVVHLLAWCCGSWTPLKPWTTQSCIHCPDVRAERQPSALHACVSRLGSLVLLLPACLSVLPAIAPELEVSEASFLHFCALGWIQGHSGSYWKLVKILH